MTAPELSYPRVTNFAHAEVDWADEDSVHRAVLAVRLLVSRLGRVSQRQADEAERLWDELQRALGAGPMDWFSTTEASAQADEEAFTAELGRWERRVLGALADGDAEALRSLVVEAVLLRDQYGLAIDLDSDDCSSCWYCRTARLVEHLDVLARIAQAAADALDALSDAERARCALTERPACLGFTPQRRRPSAGPSAHAPPFALRGRARRPQVCASDSLGTFPSRRTVPI